MNVPVGAASLASLDLDRLLDLGPDELEALYQAAQVPTLAAVSGDLRGRMLAVVAPRPVRALARAAARARWFPWKGKTFRPLDDERGEGDNRVLSQRWHWYRFTTSLGPSKAGPFEALHLDYDHPENPAFIRAIQDEIRELRPGLWLGQAWFVTRRRARLVLWFGLES